MSSIPFEEFSRVVTESGVESALDFLEQHFRREQDYFKLFEVLKNAMPVSAWASSNLFEKT